MYLSYVWLFHLFLQSNFFTLKNFLFPPLFFASLSTLNYFSYAFFLFFSPCMSNFGILVLAEGTQIHCWNDDAFLKSFCRSIPWHVATGTGATLADCFKGSGDTCDVDATPLRHSWFKALQNPTSQWCCHIFCCYWEAAPPCDFLVHLCDAPPRHFSFLQTLIQLLFNSFLHIVNVGGR